MREKYILERHPYWFSMCIGNKDISSADEVAFANARSPEEASIICKEHNKVLQALSDMAIAWDKTDPEGFTKYWYNL